MKTTPATQAGNPPSLRSALLAALAGIFILVCLFAFTGCESAAPYTPIPAEAYSPRPAGTLTAGDVIRVTYPGAPELNTVQKIEANGKVSLPTVGSVNAQGKSVATLQSQLTGLYQSHLQNPTVLVAGETAASGVYVSGEVMKPGKVALDRPMTAFEAIMEAGGFSKFANPKQVVVIRNHGGKHQRYALNLSDTLNGTSDSAFYLRPYDTIYVKQSRW